MQYSQEHLKTMVYAKSGGQTECIMGNWKIENGQTTVNPIGPVSSCNNLSNLSQTSAFFPFFQGQDCRVPEEISNRTVLL